MGDVIPVDFATLRARKEAQVAMAEANKAVKQAPAVTVNLAQAAMLRLCEMQMSEEQFTELSAAIHDYDCYSESCAHTQVLVDVYQMLEVF
jgi:nitrous oxide reductase accessory protein NosL